MSEPTQEPSSLMWIRSAITAGGVLTLKSVVPGNSICRAQMDWPGETALVGGISTTVQGALANLDNVLMEDAAQEMIKKGAV